MYKEIKDIKNWLFRVREHKNNKFLFEISDSSLNKCYSETKNFLREQKDNKNYLEVEVHGIFNQKSTLYDNDKCAGLNRGLYKEINLENLINNVSKNIYDLL